MALSRRANIPPEMARVGPLKLPEYAADIANRVARWIFAKTSTINLVNYDPKKYEPVEGWEKVSVTTDGVSGDAAITFPVPFPKECQSVVFSTTATAYTKLKSIDGPSTGFTITGPVGETFTVCYVAKGV